MRTRGVIAFGCVACILLAFADESALGNGGRGKFNYYQARTEFSGGSVTFNALIDNVLFHLLSLKEEYKVVRLQVENRSQKVLPLSREKDKVELRFGDRTIPGLLHLSGHDPILWDALDADLRKTLAYPKTIEPGEMESVYIFIPIPALKEVKGAPDILLYKIDSLQKEPIRIEPPRAKL